MSCYMCGWLLCRCRLDLELVRGRLLMRDVTPALCRLGWLWCKHRFVNTA